MDIVSRGYVNENTRIYFDEKHRWYYWHGLQADEVIAFIQADSQAENQAGMMNSTAIFWRICHLTLRCRRSPYGISRYSG
jgi:hypothetical protein